MRLRPGTHLTVLTLLLIFITLSYCQVARGTFILFFNEVFDAMFRLDGREKRGGGEGAGAAARFGAQRQGVMVCRAWVWAPHLLPKSDLALFL